jgi:hypothetical protein
MPVRKPDYIGGNPLRRGPRYIDDGESIILAVCVTIGLVAATGGWALIPAGSFLIALRWGNASGWVTFVGFNLAVLASVIVICTTEFEDGGNAKLLGTFFGLLAASVAVAWMVRETPGPTLPPTSLVSPQGEQLPSSGDAGYDEYLAARRNRPKP